MEHYFKIITLILLIHFGGVVNAQEAGVMKDSVELDSLNNNVHSPASSDTRNSQKHAIYGILVDSTNIKPLEFATVNLKASKGGSIKSSLSKIDGSFQFDELSSGEYLITIISLGYKKRMISVRLDTLGTKGNMGAITISRANKQLQEVVVMADRPIVTQEVDRISYDVQADPDSKIDNVLDMMRKVPLLSVDGEDKIKFKGSGSYKILIDGRSSSLIARNPEDVFKNMAAVNILKIEVITTPPARYDSEGLTGIINIITNKKVPGGYSASVGVRHNLLFGPGLNGSITAKRRNLGVSSVGGANWSGRRDAPFYTLTTNSQSGARYESDGAYGSTSKLAYLTTEISYEIDSLNLITTSFGVNDNLGTNNSTMINSNYNSGGLLGLDYQLSSVSDDKSMGYDLSVNWQLGFKKHKEQLLTASYRLNSFGNKSFTEVLTSEVNQSGSYLQQNKAGTNEQTIQLDYFHPLRKFSVEGGFKVILRDNFSDYGRQDFNQVTGSFLPNENQTNSFNYQQNVFSFYNSYSFKGVDWSLKAGIRQEKTVVDANFISSFQRFSANSDNFIPSIAIQRKLGKNRSINFGYTQRIQRPSVWQLNPFENKRDRFLEYGNPDLKPVLNHNFDLSYNFVKKGSYNPSLSYSFANNNIEYVSSLENDTTRVTFMNIGNNKTLSNNFYASYPFSKSLSANLNTRISYMWIDGMVNNTLFKNEGFQGSVTANLNYKTGKDWQMGISGGYYSAWITLQGQSNPNYYTSGRVTKQFLNKKVNLSASVNNPFQKMWTWRGERITPQFNEFKNYSRFYRQFNLSFNYKFGKLKDGIRKNKRGINNDDISSEK